MATKLPPKLAKMGQSLIEGPTDSITKLAQDANQKLVPTTPVDGLVMGANPNQAKMLGGAPNIRNALKMSTEGMEGDGSLADVERRGRVNKKAGDVAIDNAALTKATSLQGRVENAANTIINKAQAQLESGVALDANPDATAISNAKPKDTAALTAALDAWNKAGKVPPEERARLLATVYSLVDNRDAVPALFGMDEKAFAAEVANAVPNTLKLSDVTTQEKPDELLGIKEGLRNAGETDADLDTRFKNMTWGEYKTAVVNKSQEQYKDVSSLQAVANDVTAPASARAQAKQRLAELGVSNVTQSAASAQAMRDAVSREEKVVVNGHAFTLEELLDNQTISDAMLAGAANPDLLKDGPFSGLIPFIKTHQAALLALQTEIGVEDKLVTGYEQAAVGLNDVGGGAIPPDVMQVLFPASQDPLVKSGQKAAPEAPAAYKALAARAPSLGKDMMSLVTNAIIGLPLEMTGWLRDADADELARLGLFADPNNFAKKATNAYTVWKEIAAGKDLTDTEVTSFLDTLFGVNGSVKDLSLYSPDELSGLLPSELDTDQDGKVTPAELKTAVAKTPGATPAEQVKNLMTLPAKLDFTAIGNKAGSIKLDKQNAVTIGNSLDSEFAGAGYADKIASINGLPDGTGRVKAADAILPSLSAAIRSLEEKLLQNKDTPLTASRIAGVLAKYKEVHATLTTMREHAAGASTANNNMATIPTATGPTGVGAGSPGQINIGAGTGGQVTAKPLENIKLTPKQIQDMMAGKVPTAEPAPAPAPKKIVIKKATPTPVVKPEKTQPARNR